MAFLLLCSALLRHAALILEGGDPLSRMGLVHNYEADTRIEFARIPLALAMKRRGLAQLAAISVRPSALSRA